MSHVFQVPAEWVDDEGALRMAIQNLAPAAINFDPDDLEILYRVSSFESNFLRAALVHWSKLAFLAALAVACATALGFPVACLASITIFLAGSAAPFLARALYWYAPAEMNEIDFSDTAAGISWVFEVIIHQLAVAMTWAFRRLVITTPREHWSVVGTCPGLKCSMRSHECCCSGPGVHCCLAGAS